MSLIEKEHYDELTDTLTVGIEQDVTAILKDVEIRKEIMDSKPVEGLGYFVGRIPEAVVLSYMQEFGVTYDQFINEDIHIQRIMNNPDYKRFRVWEGRI